MGDDWEANRRDLSDLVGQCCRGLEACCALPSLMHHGWAENATAKFKHWASDIETPWTRLREPLGAGIDTAWDMRMSVMALLDILLHHIEKCQRADTADEQPADGQGSPLDDTSAPPEAADAPSRPLSPFSDSSSITSAVSLQGHPSADNHRNPGQCAVDEIIEILDSFSSTNDDFQPTFQFLDADCFFSERNHEDWSRLLTLLVLRRGKIEHRDPRDIGFVQERLVKANLMRRNRFLYARRRAEESARYTLRLSEPQAEEPALDTCHPSEPPVSGRPERVDESPGQQPRAPLSLDAVVDQVAHHVWAWSEAAMTDLTLAVDQIEWPRPPPPRDGQLHFTCPCCSRLLPGIYRQKDRWRRHLMQDINPYVCFLHNCPEPDNLYASQGDWLHHVEEHHGRIWVCYSCSNPPNTPLHVFCSPQDLVSHTRKLHHDVITEHRLPMLLKEAARASPFGINRCPLCDVSGTSDAEPLLNHIARHLQAFALLSFYSLPWAQSETGIDFFKTPDYLTRDSFTDENRANLLGTEGVDLVRSWLPPSTKFGSGTGSAFSNTMVGSSHMGWSPAPESAYDGPFAFPEANSGPVVLSDGPFVKSDAFLWSPKWTRLPRQREADMRPPKGQLSFPRLSTVSPFEADVRPPKEQLSFPGLSTVSPLKIEQSSPPPAHPSRPGSLELDQMARETPIPVNYETAPINTARQDQTRNTSARIQKWYRHISARSRKLLHPVLENDKKRDDGKCPDPNFGSSGNGASQVAAPYT